MGVVFTEEQQKVIDLRNRNLLVSAAAGSGKTAVLVERIITRLTKDPSPINVDELLVVTFTEAAASEMKERIRGAIEAALEKEPQNLHLQRQATLIHNAQVTTIHSFCLSVIREYFHVIDLDPGFRIGEEGELKLLKRDVAEELLEEKFAEGSPQFLDFVESYATGRDDKKLEEMILQVYEYSRSYPVPEKWLQDCVEHYNVPTLEAFEESTEMGLVLQEVKHRLEDMQKELRYAMELCECIDGPAAYGNAISADLAFVRDMLAQKSFSGMYAVISKLRWERLGVNRRKEVSEEKTGMVKRIREENKKLVEKLVEYYFSEEPEVLQKELYRTRANAEILVQLVKDYAELFQRKKRDKNLIDFSDMEHYALQILTAKGGAVAKEYQERFCEIMIDEYQDSNFLQEAILTSVSTVAEGKYNIFMVGDVKQSIYRFRLSRPELFMDKYYSYTKEDSACQKIDLHKNFRSRREVLDSVNSIFRQTMRKEFGGIEYDDDAALYVGASYEATEGNETEICLLDAEELPDGVEEREAEAMMIAQRIKELRENYLVLDKETNTYRKARYSDIVILTRSLVGWTDVFLRVLTKAGIPAYSVSKEGYFATREIKLLLDYLRILDNPRQDLPLVAVLRSSFANLTDEELAMIRSEGEGKTFYDRVLFYKVNGGLGTLRRKVQTFLDTFSAFRSKVPYTAIHKLLREILDQTGYGDYVAALPAGEQRIANVEMLLEMALKFESTSYKGLFHFVRYIEQLHKYDVDYGETSILEEGSDVVRMMSIHKSKGLEFPIVFVAGMKKQFNFMDVRGSIVIHPELGIGLDAVDVKRRVKSATFLKRIMQLEIQKETVAEELRVLYVALTRAKEKLIMTGTVSDFEKLKQTCLRFAVQGEARISYAALTSAKNYLDWVLPARYCDANSPIKMQFISYWNLQRQRIAQVVSGLWDKEILSEWDTDMVYNLQMKKKLEESFSYEYPYKNDPKTKQKVSVSELKKRIYLEEEEIEEEEVLPFIPKFMQEATQLTGASRGTAYHKVLEVLDFSQDYDMPRLEKAIVSMAEEGLLTSEMVSSIDLDDMQAFLQSDIGKRVQTAARNQFYHAEQPFVLGVSLGDSETTLIQGIIDVYFEEAGELVVLDYKTDRIWKDSEFVEKYKVQLDYYAKALEQITGKPVKEKIIYAFHKRKEIKI